MLEWHDLNARHEATLLWLAAMLIIGIAGSAEARRSVCDLLKLLLEPTIDPFMLLEPTISLLIVGLLANVIFLTFIAAIVGREVGRATSKARPDSWLGSLPRRFGQV